MKSSSSNYIASVFVTIVYIILCVFVLEYHRNNVNKLNLHNLFLFVGMIGQIFIIIVAYDICISKYLKESVSLYVSMYIIFLLSFSFIDIYFYLLSKDHYYGKLVSDNNIYRMFVDFFYFNISTISTISYGDISAKTTSCKLYYSYKVMMVIFMGTFLLNDIIAKSK